MRVGLFVTCLVDLMRPRIGIGGAQAARGRRLRGRRAANADLLRPARLEFGRPRLGARARAQKVIAEFEACEYVVAPSGSCAGMITYALPGPVSRRARRARARRASGREHLRADRLPGQRRAARAIPANFDGTVTYHDSCSGLRELGVKRQPRALLAKVAGLKLEGDEGSRDLLRLRRHVLGQVRRDLARLADNKCEHVARERRGGGRARRSGLHAQHRGPAAPHAATRDAGAARRRSAGGNEERWCRSSRCTSRPRRRRARRRDAAGEPEEVRQRVDCAARHGGSRLRCGRIREAALGGAPYAIVPSRTSMLLSGSSRRRRAAATTVLCAESREEACELLLEICAATA